MFYSMFRIYLRNPPPKHVSCRFSQRIQQVISEITPPGLLNNLLPYTQAIESQFQPQFPWEYKILWNSNLWISLNIWINLKNEKNIVVHSRRHWYIVTVYDVRRFQNHCIIKDIDTFIVIKVLGRRKYCD